MTWVRIDDEFPQHPKIASVGPLGMALQVAGLCYCNRYLTDGFIPLAVARTLLDFTGLGMRMWDSKPEPGGTSLFGGGEDATAGLVIEDLVEADVWKEAEVDGFRGYLIHDYLDYQPSKAQVEAERQLKVAAGQAGGQASAQARAQAKSKQVLNGISTEGQARAQAKSNPKPIPKPIPIPKPKPKVTPPLSPSRGNTHKGKITPEFIESMVIEWESKLGGEQAARDIIADALNHKAIDKAKDKTLYLERWLQRDAKRMQPQAPQEKPELTYEEEHSLHPPGFWTEIAHLKKEHPNWSGTQFGNEARRLLALQAKAE